MAPECSHMTTICHFPFWFQWKHLSCLPKLWNFHLVDSKCFQIKFITNTFFFTGRCHFQLSNIRITKRFWLASDDDYLRGATSINHQVALRANFKMYSRSAKGGEKGDPIVDVQIIIFFQNVFFQIRFKLHCILTTCYRNWFSVCTVWFTPPSKMTCCNICFCPKTLQVIH